MATNLVDAAKQGLSTRRGKLIFGVAIALVLTVFVIIGDLIYQNYEYVATDNAYIKAPLISVPAFSSTQIIEKYVDLGDYVEKGEKIAAVGRPRPSDPADVLGYRDVPMGRTVVEAPVSGYVASYIYPGAVISAGMSIVQVYDVSQVSVLANISEADIHRIKPGQEVEITVDSLGEAIMKGKVEGITAATAATFSLLPQNNTTGNFVKVVQVIPVNISIENTSNNILIPGTSVEVKIKVN